MLQISVALDSGRTYRDVDIELISGDKRFYYLFDRAPGVEELNRYEVLLREVGTDWKIFVC